MTSRIVVVGASLGGLRAAEQLRAAGYAGPVTLVGEEPYLPYNRPPLTKDILSDPGDSDPARLHAKVAFRRRASVADVDFVLGRRAVLTDHRHRRVVLDDGTELMHEGLVVATGLRPRRLDVPGPTAGRFAVRTLDDTVALREALSAGCRVVVVGGGFVGCEAAATLTKLGCSVTLVEPFGQPMERALGTDLSGAVRRHLETAGIAVVTGVGVTEFQGTDRVAEVVLGDGRQLPATVVVEAVGSACNTEWLAGHPRLDLSDGVLCDNHLAVVGAERTVAVGDVARFPNPLVDDVPRRVEHWSMPTDTARRAARTLVAQITGEPLDPAPFAPVPSFWSDQLDLRFQAFGSPGLADVARLEEGDLDAVAEGVLVTYHRQGRHIGTVAVNLPPARQRDLRAAFDLLPAA